MERIHEGDALLDLIITNKEELTGNSVKVCSKPKMVGLRILGGVRQMAICELWSWKVVFSLYKDLFVRILWETELEKKKEPRRAGWFSRIMLGTSWKAAWQRKELRILVNS